MSGILGTAQSSACSPNRHKASISGSVPGEDGPIAHKGDQPEAGQRIPERLCILRTAQHHMSFA